MRAFWVKIIWLFVFSLAVYFGVRLFLNQRASNQKITAYEVVKRADLMHTVTLPGTVQSAKNALITPPYDGYVKELYVKLGQTVKKGDPLVSVVTSLESTETVYPIRAPFTGKVTQIVNGEGTYIHATDWNKFILRVDDLSAFFMEVRAPEVDIVKLKVGLEALVKVVSLNDERFSGELIEISNSPIQ